MGVRAVGADAEDLGVEVLVRRVVVTERGGFDRSAGGVVPDVEPQHDPRASKIRETHAPALIVGQREFRSPIAFLDHGTLLPPCVRARRYYT